MIKWKLDETRETLNDRVKKEGENEVAEAIGITRKALVDFINGITKNPHVQTMEKYARYLGVKVSDLMISGTSKSIRKEDEEKSMKIEILQDLIKKEGINEVAKGIRIKATTLKNFINEETNPQPKTTKKIDGYLKNRKFF